MIGRKSNFKKGDVISGRFYVRNIQLGGFSEIYMCEDLVDNRIIGFKTLRHSLVKEKELRESFQREVEKWVALKGIPNITKCFSLVELESIPFAVMEWIEGNNNIGATLKDHIDNGKIEIQRALEISLSICNGLVKAQKVLSGFVHSDLKPDNILITSTGTVKLTDFGFAKFKGQNKHLSGGTYKYLAPELRNKNQNLGADEKTDVFSFGCIMFEMLTSKPFLQNGFFRKSFGKTEIRLKSQTIDPKIALIIEKCLYKDRLKRYESFSTILKDIREVLPKSATNSEIETEVSSEAEDLFGTGEAFLRLFHLNKDSLFLEKSHDALNKSISNDPEFMPSYVNRGSVFSLQKKYEEALKDYFKALSLFPDDPYTLTNIGIVYKNMENYDKAIEYHTKAISIEKRLDSAYHNRANAFFLKEFFSEALEDVNHALKLNPMTSEYYITKGKILNRTGNFKEALSVFLDVYKLQPSNPEIPFSIGLMYEKLDCTKKAILYYKESLNLDPDYVDSNFNLGAILANLGQNKKAYCYIKKAMELKHPSGIINYNHLLEMDPSLRFVDCN